MYGYLTYDYTKSNDSASEWPLRFISDKISYKVSFNLEKLKDNIWLKLIFSILHINQITNKIVFTLYLKFIGPYYVKVNDLWNVNYEKRLIMLAFEYLSTCQRGNEMHINVRSRCKHYNHIKFIFLSWKISIGFISGTNGGFRNYFRGVIKISPIFYYI